ncbi:MAG: hypothetical protein ABNH21_06555 [Glaciecola sp.]|jgi:hypothetical protein
MRLDLNPDQYWRMSPHETSTYIEAKRPRVQIGGLSEDDLKDLSSKALNDERHI